MFDVTQNQDKGEDIFYGFIIRSGKLLIEQAKR
jgi:hypothetical protein